ncbi:MAG: toxin-antitoxin system HicB family antitoxin [Ruminococcaceae bacterium]|nr:toxin-antitoxin system HicB family antitoxin [Oscillospiraceae bacterium]
MVWRWYGLSTVFFNLRIDEELNERLVKIAAEEGRSKNKQIEYILKEYVKKYEQSNGAININQTNNGNATVNIK